ncbi:hypothetical protein C2G38_2154704 [Gigaspora rosea]|uniref:Uncharacterized protein n=1 Tax=Gigaspora rosea TaxID=44941 RepID=A0A397W6L4_9GLOM|nr:hypothetical protein C2G38_2154704 [Gigaspora rosea]
MNPEIPEERKYIEELTQYLYEELNSKESYKVKGKDIFRRTKTSEIHITSKNLYTTKRLLRRIKLLYEAIQEEITRIAVQYYLENNEEFTIYNCFKERKYYFYFQESEQLFRHINILQEKEPVGEYERQYIQKEYRNSIRLIIRRQKFLRSITKDYIDLQDSNQEDNVVEQILSKEELNIKLQGLLDQIKIQIQTLQGQLTLEEAYKNNEYTFLFKRTTAIYKTINSNKPEVIVQRKYLSQIRKLVEFYIKESNLTEYWFYLKSTGLLRSHEYIRPTIDQLLKGTYKRKHQQIPTVEKLLEGTYNNNKEYELAKTKEKQFRDTHEEETLLALERARQIQENDQITPIIFPNTGLTQATQDFLLQHHTQLIQEQNSKRIKTLEPPRLKEYYKTALISISVNQGILKERIKEISIQNIEGEIVDKIIETLLHINNTKINPTNNSRLGAILLKLERAKSIAREFYPHVLEYDKQRPNKIPAHILTRTQTLFPELTGRALVKEQEKQRNIYNNFLDNTQAQIEGIKKRLLAESPEFCKIFEDNPETGETEFYYGDYNNQFTILPFRFHHLIFHHLEAIDNILYSEGARNKIYFEEEESYESAYSEINKLSQEFIDKTKEVKELRKEKERLEQITNKIINRILLKNELVEKPKRIRSNSF